MESKGLGVNLSTPIYKKDRPSLRPTAYQISLIKALTYFISVQVQEMGILLMKKQIWKG